MSELLSHHATALVGASLEVYTPLVKSLADLGINEKMNPDFIREKFEVLTIDDSRRLRQIHESMPFSPIIPRIFILEINGITREAQNALLKTLEEPRPHNFFFIIVPSIDILLPTVQSRLRIISGHQFVGRSTTAEPILTSQNETARNFLKMPLAEKIIFVDNIAADISDEKISKHSAIVFLNDLERELRKYILEGKTAENLLKSFTAISKARDYLNDRAPSVKMLLEYVALSVESR